MKKVIHKAGFVTVLIKCEILEYSPEQLTKAGLMNSYVYAGFHLNWHLNNISSTLLKHRGKDNYR